MFFNDVPPRPVRAPQRGITGLETAIILIAFVIVASIFAFTVLSAGMFSAERSKETVYAGLQEASDSLEPKGGVTVLSDSVSGTTSLVQVKFTVGGSVSGPDGALDLTPPYVLNSTGTDPDASGLANSAVISYMDSTQRVSSAVWTIEFVGGSNGDYVLERDEMAQITVWLHQLNTATGLYTLGTAGSSYLQNRLGVNTRFSITIDVGSGGAFVLERVVPGRLQSVMSLK